MPATPTAPLIQSDTDASQIPQDDACGVPAVATEAEEQKRKRGAQPGNTNAQRHGLRSAQLPKDARTIEDITDEYRLALEQRVMERHGEISVGHAGLICTALRFEKRAALAEWNRRQPDTPRKDWDFYSEVAADASDARDAVVAVLLPPDQSKAAQPHAVDRLQRINDGCCGECGAPVDVTVAQIRRLVLRDRELLEFGRWQMAEEYNKDVELRTRSSVSPLPSSYAARIEVQRSQPDAAQCDVETDDDL